METSKLNDMKALAYSKIIPHSFSAIQEQQVHIEANNKLINTNDFLINSLQKKTEALEASIYIMVSRMSFSYENWVWI